MIEGQWLDIIARVSTREPIDLDRTVFRDVDKPVPQQPAPAAGNGSDDRIPPSVMLWVRAENNRSYIGVRVNKRLPDCTQAAFRLAAAALERDVSPIILSSLADSGFERFGFRVERIVGDTPQERLLLEEELRRFWNMAIIIDVSDVASLG